ncbi:MAG: hypothetical protein KGL40_02990 [Rhodocyclaceae bacterium]|nr:hypothetical protein [Rhodocyclaceae bacterium]
MQLPLRLQLKPSRSFLVFLAGGHILAGVAVCLLPLPPFMRAGLVTLLGLLFLRQWHACSRNLPGLLLRRDGKLELIAADGKPTMAEVGDDTVVWPWLVVLHLTQEAGVRNALRVLPDSFADADAHRQLRVWLRWRSDSSTD